jgi:hypothetical protein
MAAEGDFMLWNKPLDQIDKSDIGRLVSDGSEESQNLEFKSQPWSDSPHDRAEYLFDVAALANAYGGRIVVGIRAEGDRAAEVVPVQDAERTAVSLADRATASIEPRIQGLGVRAVPVEGGHVVVVHVPRSGRGPHMVTLKDANKFYRRHGKTKLLMSVDEIGDAFLLAGRRQDETLKMLTAHQAAREAACSLPTLCLAAKPLSYYPRPINVREEWARAMLIDPPFPISTENVVYAGIGRSAQGEELVPNLEGLVRRRQGAEHTFRFSLSRSGLLYFHTTYILMAQQTRNLESGEVWPQRFIPLTIHFFRVAKAMAGHLGFEGEFASYVSLESLRRTPTVTLRRNAPVQTSVPWSMQENLAAEPPAGRIAPEPFTWSTDDNPDTVARTQLDLIYNAYGFYRAPLFRNGVFDVHANTPET